MKKKKILILLLIMSFSAILNAQTPVDRLIYMQALEYRFNQGADGFSASLKHENNTTLVIKSNDFEDNRNIVLFILNTGLDTYGYIYYKYQFDLVEFKHSETVGMTYTYSDILEIFTNDNWATDYLEDD